ncbi:hypothetical protein GBAR_LOCUS14882, partial [Geodia barretti]
MHMKNTSMSKHGSTVTIDCFPDGDNTSCVSIYRAYDNPTVKHIDTFPADVTLQPGEYTFALFKSIGNTSIDERPFITRVFTVENDEPTSSLPDGSPSVVVALVLVVLFIMVTGVILLMVWKKHPCLRRILKEDVCLKPQPSSSFAGGGVESVQTRRSSSLSLKSPNGDGPLIFSSTNGVTNHVQVDSDIKDPCDDNPVRMMTGVEEIEPPYEGKKEEDV